MIDGRQNAFLTRQDGVLSHTNHFILKETKAFNPKMGASSQARLNRIEKVIGGKSIHKGARLLLLRRTTQTVLETFRSVAMARMGTQAGERTLSAAVFYLPRQSAPEIWVALGQPCQSTFEKR